MIQNTEMCANGKVTQSVPLYMRTLIIIASKGHFVQSVKNMKTSNKKTSSSVRQYDSDVNRNDGLASMKLIGSLKPVEEQMMSCSYRPTTREHKEKQNKG